MILGGVEYRSSEDLADAQANDPLVALKGSGRIPEERLVEIRTAVDREIEAAIARALQAPPPEPNDAFTMTSRRA
jgi:TPP-dependent pyruvate/acetoin dehydrogenase alpha subunit